MKILIALSFMLIATPAFCHNFWGNGDEVDPTTKQKCCGENDCHSFIAPNEPTKVDGGYSVKDESGVERFVPDYMVQPSKDGYFWICEWGNDTSWDIENGYQRNVPQGRIKCFFAPLTY
jgi:hypothetical protein